MLRIGTITIPSRCLLAPLAGISDLPFRMINRHFGCEFAFTEMISARALAYQSGNTLGMLDTIPGDRPLGVQLVGDDLDVLRTAVDKLDDRSFALIDLNAACPVRKVTAKGEGASLMRDPIALKKLLRGLVSHAPVPVTVKIRSGWDDESVNARDVALHAEDAGVYAITVHGRTRAQGYSGRVDYDVIRSVKEAVQIPVIGSGDALSQQHVRKMFDETGCDGIAIARGALGNPWIFRETAAFLESGKTPSRPGMEELMHTMITHLDSCIDYYGNHRGVMIFRKFMGWYMKGLPCVRTMREKGFHARTREEMTGLIESLRGKMNDTRCASVQINPHF